MLRVFEAIVLWLAVAPTVTYAILVACLLVIPTVTFHVLLSYGVPVDYPTKTPPQAWCRLRVAALGGVCTANTMAASLFLVAWEVVHHRYGSMNRSAPAFALIVALFSGFVAYHALRCYVKGYLPEEDPKLGPPG